MSKSDQARRTAVEVKFDGVDITDSLRAHLISLTYTDNEEDAADDLQIKLHDRDDIWLSKWLDQVIQAAANRQISENDKAKDSPYWNIGDEVTVTGRPLESSYGLGNIGDYVNNYKGTITYLNLKDGVPHPIHVGYLGWFKESEVKKNNDNSQSKSGKDSSVSNAASKGLMISAVIITENRKGDGNDEILECGRFELDSITAQGPPSTITIKGTSLPYHSTIRQMLKSKSWEECSLSQIANEIASKNGMTCMFLSASDPFYKRREQYKASDIAFLKKLCHDAGCSLKISDNIIVIFNQSEYEAKSAIYTIKKGKTGGYSKYRLSTESNDKYASCRVSYTDNNGKVISATAYSDETVKNNSGGQCLEVRQRVSSESEALALAEKMLRLHNKYEYTAGFTFPGNPKFLAGCTVQLSGWGAWNGKYIIKQAKHSVGGSGYTTQIELRKSLGSYESVNKEPSAPEPSIDDIARACIRGDWGNGEERKKRLTEAGYDYDQVQARVNEILYG